MKNATRKLRFETLGSRRLLAVDALVAAAAESGDGVTDVVIFDDRGTHIIDDDSYALDLIEVRNHTTLIIADGAVISASIAPLYEWDSGPVLEFSAAAIRVFDNSKLIVEGGVFGGDRTDIPGCTGDPLCDRPFADNWYSGSIAAFDHANVTIKDGTFGRWAFRSGATAIFDHAKLDVSGGTFTDPFEPSPSGLGGQAGGGTIELYDKGRADISGGLHASSINPVDNSTLKISGGTFGKGNFPDGGLTFFRGAVQANGSAAVTISGGDFGADGVWSGFVGASGSSTLKITGGTFTGDTEAPPFTPGWRAGRVELSDNAQAKISGGQFNTTMGVNLGQLKIEGDEFNLPFGKLSDTSAQLQGILSNGDEIDVDITREDDPNAIIKLIKTETNSGRAPRAPLAAAAAAAPVPAIASENLDVAKEKHVGDTDTDLAWRTAETRVDFTVEHLQRKKEGFQEIRRQRWALSDEAEKDYVDAADVLFADLAANLSI